MTVTESVVDARAAHDNPAIHLENVSLWTAQRTEILQDIDWSVRLGERWVLIGPNGSGKSTLLSLAGAVRHPSRGSVTVLGGLLGRVDMPALRQAIGHVDAGVQLFDWLTAEDVVLTGIGATARPLWWKYSASDHETARAMLDLLGCAGLANREISTCSQGERGRIRIARALIAHPRLLLLDEPAVGLDLAAREALIVALDRLSRDRPELTTVLVTHHLEEIPPSMTHAILLRSGRVVASGPIAATLTSSNLSTSFGLPVVCRSESGRWTARAEGAWSRT